jgi:hypothetical protein
MRSLHQDRSAAGLFQFCLVWKQIQASVFVAQNVASSFVSPDFRLAVLVDLHVAVCRKNHYGSRSERGTRVAALFYSLIESTKPVVVEPGACFGKATRRTIRNPGTVTLARDLK